MAIKSGLNLILIAALAFSSLSHSQTPPPFQYGFVLPNSGTRFVHGNGALIRNAFPPELNIPGQQHVFTPGHTVDPTIPTFSGGTGFSEFDVNYRPPRHVHMAPKSHGSGNLFVTERIYVIGGVAVTEQAGEYFVVPPNTMVITPPGVPHCYTAAPPGIDFQALGISGSEPLISTGQFTAIFEYDYNTTFYPTAQTQVLKKEKDYVKPSDLNSIRIPAFTIEELKKNARFVWGREAKKLNGTAP